MIPTVPKFPEASSLSVAQLKDVLRRHGAKLSGRKAELIERVLAGNFLSAGRQEQLREHEKEKDDVILKRIEIQQQLDTRAARLRNVAAGSVPRAPTEADVDAIAGKELEGFCREGEQPNGMLEKLLAKQPRLREQCTSQRDRSRSPRLRIDSRPICQYHLRGTCHFGYRCDNRHESVPGAALARSGLGPLCCFFQQGRCRFGIVCDFSHEKRHGESRACQFGVSCKLGHGSRLGQHANVSFRPA